LLPAVLAAAALVACSGSSPKVTAGSSSAKPGSSSANAASSPTGDPLSSIGLTPADLPAGDTMKLLPGGDQAAGQVTLDMCGADFPSETLRTDRLQHAATNSSGKRVVSDEAVRYRSASAAAQALTELRKAVSGCDPSTFQISHVEEMPPLQYALVPLPESQLTGLAKDHVGFSATLTSQTGKTESTVLIFQRRGAMLVGIYGAIPETTLPFAQVVATRLGALTPDQAGE
jgi:hypothetical protein